MRRRQASSRTARDHTSRPALSRTGTARTRRRRRTAALQRGANGCVLSLPACRERKTHALTSFLLSLSTHRSTRQRTTGPTTADAPSCRPCPHARAGPSSRRRHEPISCAPPPPLDDPPSRCIPPCFALPVSFRPTHTSPLSFVPTATTRTPAPHHLAYRCTTHTPPFRVLTPPPKDSAACCAPRSHAHDPPTQINGWATAGDSLSPVTRRRRAVGRGARASSRGFILQGRASVRPADPAPSSLSSCAHVRPPRA